MHQNGILDNYRLPDERPRAAFQNFQRIPLEADGTERIHISGHDKGVGIRFWIHQEYNPTKSKIARYEVFDPVYMVEWLVDKRTKPTEQVRFLPEELLTLDEDGTPIGGRFREAYERFLTGQTAPGMRLSRWGVLDDSLVASLAAAGIFSVEQFAAMPRSKVTRYPQEVVEAFDRAVQYVNGKEDRDRNDKLINELATLKLQDEKKDREIAELRSELRALGAKKTKRTRKPKEASADVD